MTTQRTVPPLTDGVVVLRRHEERDIPGVLAQATDPESIRWTTVPLAYTLDMARSWVLEEIPAAWLEDSSYGLAITDTDDCYLGTIDVRPLGSRAAEVGYALTPAARGRGVMRRALSLATDWAFAPPGAEGLDLELLRWMSQVGNYPSRRVAWAAGFTVDATVRGALEQRGELLDAWVGTLHRSDTREPKTTWWEAPLLTRSLLTGPSPAGKAPHGSVVLRPWRADDATALVEMNTDPLTQHWLAHWIPSPYTLERAQWDIASRPTRQADGVAVSWAVSDAPDGPLLGSLSIHKISDNRGEVGYRFHPAGRGRGLAAAAVRLVAQHALRPREDGGMGLRRLELYAAAGNTASNRVAERAGFTYWGKMRRDEVLGDGTWDDVAAYDMLAGEQG